MAIEHRQSGEEPDRVPGELGFVTKVERRVGMGTRDDRMLIDTGEALGKGRERGERLRRSERSCARRLRHRLWTDIARIGDVVRRLRFYRWIERVGAAPTFP